jgi:hypothetical protein
MQMNMLLEVISSKMKRENFNYFCKFSDNFRRRTFAWRGIRSYFPERKKGKSKRVLVFKDKQRRKKNVNCSWCTVHHIRMEVYQIITDLL